DHRRRRALQGQAALRDRPLRRRRRSCRGEDDHPSRRPEPRRLGCRPRPRCPAHPGRELADRLGELPAPGHHPQIVTYCWGPGCNASTKAALTLARAGYGDVREMIGGFEYWVREGLAVETASGRTRRAVDPLTGVPA